MFSDPNPFIINGLFLIVAFLGLQCEHAGPLEVASEQKDEAPTLSSIQGIFTQNCAISGCHAGPNALLGLDLSAGQSYNNMVGVQSKEAPALQIVSPNSPDDSYLIVKLEGSARMAAGTMLMPIGRSPLNENDINNIRDWILDGAKDN